MEAMILKGKRYLERYKALDDMMMDEGVLRNPKKMTAVAKEQASIREIVETFKEYQTIHDQLDQAKALLNEKEEDIVEMAEMEIEELEPKLDALKSKLEVLMLPKDPDDDKNVIMEIRGAAGGDEGNIFAGDLYRMYSRFAEIMGWKTEVLEASEAEAGGYTLISFIIKGEQVFRYLKFESGAHRVQRVPKTETQGRVHTSTATVLAMAEAEEDDIEINPDDLTIDTHRASGAGGQHVNKTDSAVRITHVPTGISVNVQDGRSQHANRDMAMKIIRARVYEAHMAKIEAEKGQERLSKIGRGSRSEKIRTYNYPQNRVTDHRIGLTIVQLDRIVEGKMDDIFEALLQWEQKEKLEAPINENT
jgi:peptide chain release factor 1